MSTVRPSPGLANRVISTFSFDPKPLAKPTESPSRGGQQATWVGLWNDPGICRVVGKGAVECHKRAMSTPSRTMDPDFTRSYPLASSLSTSLELEPSRQATLAQPLRLRETTDGATHKTQSTPIKPQQGSGAHPIPKLTASDARPAPTPGSTSFVSPDP